MTCIAKPNRKFISTSHPQQSWGSEQFCYKRGVFDSYFYHKLQKKKKNPSINYGNRYSVLKLWQHWGLSEVKDTFRNRDFTIPHNVSNHFHYASVWRCLKLHQHCLLSHHWKIMIITKKTPLKYLPLLFPCVWKLVFQMWLSNSA